MDDNQSQRPAKRLKLSYSDLTDQKEMDVGVSDFVNDEDTTFTALFKQRYTDFLVNEILPSGKVLQLRSTNLAKQARVEEHQEEAIVVTQTEEAQPSVEGAAPLASVDVQSNGQAMNEISPEDKAKLTEYFNAEAVEELLTLHQAILAEPKKKPKDHRTVRTSFTSDRAIRAQIHQDIRRIFKNHIDSSTDQSGMLVLTAAYTKNRDDGRRTADSKPQRHGKLSWLDRGGEYLHFTLYKENKDTMEVISYISKQLKTTPKTFQFAGTKDRRAVTVQRASAYRVDAARLVGLNRMLRGSALGDFDYRHDKLELGDLGGNEFTVTLRDCKFTGAEDMSTSELLNHAQSIMTSAMQSLSTNGFLNFYGLQRFGTYSTRTDTVGLHLLRSDFRAAIDAILNYHPSALAAAQNSSLQPTSTPIPTSTIGSDDIHRAEAIHGFRTTSDIQHALSILPRKFSAESQILRSLAKNPSDHLGAVLTIQRNLRLMYVHAYQSRIWNLAVVHRWKLYGSRVVEGDLVLLNDFATSTQQPEEVDELGEPIITPSSVDRATTSDDIYVRARALSADEATSGDYTIHDIVLPLPGYDIIYPPNALKEFYKTMMASEDGGGLDYMDMRRKQRDFSLSGSYRKVVATVGKDWEVDVRAYKEETEQFVTTDLEKLKRGGNGGEEKQAGREVAQDDENGKVQGGVEEVMQEHRNQNIVEAEQTEKKEKIAVILKFQLGSSQYATMALRELSKGGVREYKPEFSGGR